MMTRRPFLRTTAASALATCLARGQGESGGRKLGWALVGLGSLSTHQIAPALAKTKHARLAAIVTGTPSKAEDWKKRHQLDDAHIYDYESFDRIADDPEIDVVYIVLPNGMHAEYTIRAAKAGKHVFCEKPMANTAAECREMIAACRDAGKRLGVAYRCQFEPHHREAIRFAHEKVFGPVRHLNAAFGFRIGDPNQWRLKKELAGGGALMDVGVYALQACRYLSGEEPVEIIAQETKTDPEKFTEVDETIVWSMKFPSGITASCQTTYAYGGMNRFEAICDRGRFGMDPAYSYGGLKGWTSREDVPLSFPQIDHFSAEIDAFSKAILDGGEFGPEGEDGLRDLEVVEAIYRSIREGRAVKL